MRHSGWMPLIGADELLLDRPRRALIAGTAGAGKTTLAARVAEVLGIPQVEIDGLFHGPGWTSRQAFEADVRRFAATQAWVTEWQYGLVRPLLAQRADLLVWLDLSRATVIRQVVRRTLRRRLRKEMLWNGNLEPPLWTIFTDRDHIVRWAWSTHSKSAARVAAAVDQCPELVVVRLRDRRAVERWLRGPLRRAAARPSGLGSGSA